VSVTTGVMGGVRVHDDRVVSRTGWDQIANVTDFVNDANAHYPGGFASAAPHHGVGDTVLGGVLTVVSPADIPAGTYSAVLILTVVSQ
jgi:hypothetical protein